MVTEPSSATSPTSARSCSAGPTRLDELLIGAVAAPDSAPPIDAMAADLQAVAAILHERRDFARKRRSIIAANAEL